MSNQQVSLRLTRVICRDETGGSLVEKFGNDEISLSVIGIDATGAVTKLDPFEVGANFDDREVKQFDPPKTLLTLAVPEAGAFPKSCLAMFLLAETADGSGHRAATQKAFAEATKMVATKKADMIANGEDPNTTPDLGGVIWDAMKEALFGFVVGVIKSGLNDDVFPPQMAPTVTINSPDFHFAGGTKISAEDSSVFNAHGGKYEIVYHWQVETIASPVTVLLQ